MKGFTKVKSKKLKYTYNKFREKCENFVFIIFDFCNRIFKQI